jgi:hypothetical protein
MALPVASSFASTGRGFFVVSASGGNVQPLADLAGGCEGCFAAIAATVIDPKHNTTAANDRRFMDAVSCSYPVKPILIGS